MPNRFSSTMENARNVWSIFMKCRKNWNIFLPNLKCLCNLDSLSMYGLIWTIRSLHICIVYVQTKISKPIHYNVCAVLSVFLLIFSLKYRRLRLYYGASNWWKPQNICEAVMKYLWRPTVQSERVLELLWCVKCNFCSWEQLCSGKIKSNFVFLLNSFLQFLCM